MIGHIESFDPETQTGAIHCEGKYYEFHLDDWKADVPPDVGDDVNFEVTGTVATGVNLVGAYLGQAKAVKYKYLAAALSLFFGFAGLSRLYLGFYRIAVMQIALTAFLLAIGGPGFTFLWGFIETILLVGGQINKDAKGRLLK